MIVALAELVLYIPEADSLKDKRRVLKSLLSRLRGHFNVAAAEVDGCDSWRSATVGLALVSNQAGHADSNMAAAVRFVESFSGVEVLEIHQERV